MGFYCAAASSNKKEYSIGSAIFSNIERGSLSHTGTVNLAKSLPIASLKISKIFSFFLIVSCGSLSLYF